MKKYFKGIQEKMVSVLARLTKLWSFMEQERELIAPDDEAADGHQEMVSLFEQTILLAGQGLNSVAYQRRLNVLNTLIENNVKVKEILKEPMLNLDAIDNDFIFGESLRNSYQKLQLQNKNPNQYSLGVKKNPNIMNQFVNLVNQPFWSDSLPNSQQRGTG